MPIKNGRYFIFVLLLILGCSQGAMEKSPPVTIPSVTPGKSDAAQMIDQAQVTCSRSENCNESTGILLIAADDGPHACTASLIGADVLMTSAYCLDSLKLASATDCSGKIWVKFPTIGGLAAETEECANVVKTTDYVDGADSQVAYTFLKLKAAPHRVPLALNFNGFNDQEIFSVYKFDYSLNGKQISAVMNRAFCRSVQNSMALPDFNRATAPLASMVGCEITDDNSGAPLLDGHGQVHGVIQAGKPSPYQSSFQTYLLDEKSEPIHLASNLACMTSRVALPGRKADPACGNTGPLIAEVAPSFSNLKANLHPALDGEEKSLNPQIPISDLSPHVQWTEGEISSSASILADDIKIWGGEDGVLGVAPIPICIANQDSWIQDYSGGIFGMKKSADEPLKLPVTIFRVGVDRDDVPGYRSTGTTTVSATLHFNPQEVLHKNMGTFEIHLGSEVLFSGVIKKCP